MIARVRRYRVQGSALFVILSLILVLAGCVSTQDRYEKAQALTNQGRYAEAARYYVRVLREEPSWEHAREELQPVGQRAVDQWLEDAEAAADEGRYEPAVAVLDELDALRVATESVGVTLSVPDDYTAFRSEMVQSAADMLIAEGRRAEEVADWPAADQAYDRAREYVQSAERLATLDRAQARVALRWSEDDMERRHFRDAYLQADRVFDFVGTEHTLAKDAEALQAEAVECGTRVVAFLPLWRTQQAAAVAPEYFLVDLNDMLLYDYWSAPPLFIASTNPVETRRTLRRMNLHRTVLAASDAADVGRTLDTDFVVAGELTTFVREEDDLEEERVPSRIRVRGNTGRGPQWRDTSYVVQTFDLVLEAAVDYRIVDPRTGRIVDQGVAHVRHEGRRQRGLFRGDYRQLDLSGSELSLFDREDQRVAERAIENQLLDRLTADVADGVFDRVLRQID